MIVFSKRNFRSLSLWKKMLLLVYLKWNSLFSKWSLLIDVVVVVVVEVIHVFKHRVWECKAGFGLFNDLLSLRFDSSFLSLWRGKNLQQIFTFLFKLLITPTFFAFITILHLTVWMIAVGTFIFWRFSTVTKTIIYESYFGKKNWVSFFTED